jgi:hypothetical protein
LKLGTLKDHLRAAQSQEVSPAVDEKSSKPKGLLYAPVIRVFSRGNLFHLHRSVRWEGKGSRVERLVIVHLRTKRLLAIS